MAKRQFTLTEAEQNALRRAEGQAQDGRTVKRLQAVRLYGSGYAVSEIMAITGCSWRALMDWCVRYRQEGPGGLSSKWQGENALKLSRAQRVDLQDRLRQYQPSQVLEAEVRISQGEFWTVSDLAMVIKRWYGVTYQCRDTYVRLLHECQFSQQQTERLYRSQPDPQTVAEFEAHLEKK
jgi:transposase